MDYGNHESHEIINGNYDNHVSHEIINGSHESHEIINGSHESHEIINGNNIHIFSLATITLVKFCNNSSSRYIDLNLFQVLNGTFPKPGTLVKWQLILYGTQESPIYLQDPISRRPTYPDDRENIDNDMTGSSSDVDEPGYVDYGTDSDSGKQVT